MDVVAGTPPAMGRDGAVVRDVMGGVESTVTVRESDTSSPDERTCPLVILPVSY